MTYKQSFCRFCSIGPYDYKTLIVERYSMKCTSCGKMLFQLPSGESSPYFYLEEVPRYGRRERTK
jgi:hypothetical protein